MPTKRKKGNHCKPYCMFCGANVNGISSRTEEKVSSIYYCANCKYNYCDQCSYEKEVDGKRVQRCLRCEGDIDKVI